MGNRICCPCCGRCHQVLFQKLGIQPDDEEVSLLQDSERTKSSVQDLAGSDYGRCQYGTLIIDELQSQASVFFQDTSEERAGQVSKEDEGISGCEGAQPPSCHSGRSSEPSHTYNAFHSDLPAGRTDVPGPHPSLPACAASGLNFESPGGTADPSEDCANKGAMQSKSRDRPDDSFTSDYGKGLQISSPLWN